MQHGPAESHNVGNGANGCPSNWTFSPVFGIIHAKNCPACRAYMMHIAVANQSGDASFKNALNDKEKSASTVTAYLDGVQSGRQLQQEHHVPVLDRFREERDHALHSLDQNEQLLDAAKKEIQALRDEILALRAMHNGITSRSSESPGLNVAKSPAASDVSSIEGLLLSASTDYIDVVSTPASSAADKQTPQIASGSMGMQRSAHQGESLKAEKVPESYAAASPSNISVLSPLDSPHETDTLITNGSQTHKSATHSSLMPSSPPLQIQRPASVPTQAAQAHIPPPSVAIPLITSTRNGDSCVFQAEIYVDASQWGVGFVMNGSWSAWRFSDSLLAGGIPFDINWAEMLAVEVGLWTVVHLVYMMLQKEGECFNLVEVLVRCDNAGVVKAIEKRHSGFQPQQDILRRVLDMIDEYDVNLAVKWVSSMDNLADNPSRGLPSHGMIPLPFIPLLPSYLSDTLIPFSTNNTTHTTR